MLKGEKSFGPVVARLFRSIDPKRVEFIPRLGVQMHFWPLFAMADVLLHPFPFGIETAYDGIVLGVLKWYSSAYLPGAWRMHFSVLCVEVRNATAANHSTLLPQTGMRTSKSPFVWEK